MKLLNNLYGIILVFYGIAYIAQHLGLLDFGIPNIPGIWFLFFIAAEYLFKGAK